MQHDDMIIIKIDDKLEKIGHKYVGLGFRVHTGGKKGSLGSTPERRRPSGQRWCLRGVEEIDE